MSHPRTILKLFLSVFLGVIFPPVLILIWTQNNTRTFLLVLVVFIALSAFAKPLVPLSLLLSIYLVLEYRQAHPDVDQREVDA